MTTMNSDATSNILYEYGSACANALVDTNGGQIKRDLSYISDVLQADSIESIEDLREYLGLCDKGGGHWAHLSHDSVCYLSDERLHEED